MKTTPTQYEYILDQLSFVKDLKGKKMFGEYGLYSGDKFFALICRNQLFIKATDDLKLLMEDDGMRAYETATDGYWHITDIVIEDKEELQKLVKASLNFTPKPKKPKKM
jgi:TfoX/Sxy family transcriptional regulator of competence genes